MYVLHQIYILMWQNIETISFYKMVAIQFVVAIAFCFKLYAINGRYHINLNPILRS